MVKVLVENLFYATVGKQGLFIVCVTAGACHQDNVAAVITDIVQFAVVVQVTRIQHTFLWICEVLVVSITIKNTTNICVNKIKCAVVIHIQSHCKMIIARWSTSPNHHTYCKTDNSTITFFIGFCLDGFSIFCNALFSHRKYPVWLLIVYVEKITVVFSH